MENYIQKALKAVLEGKFDCNEQRVGNYHVTMKWDGYSAMVDINYLRPNGQHDYEICHWDSLDKRIELPDEENLHGKRRVKVLMAIRAIQSLGYEIKKVQVDQHEPGEDAFHDKALSRLQKRAA